MATIIDLAARRQRGTAGSAETGANADRRDHAAALLADFLKETRAHPGYPWQIKPEEYATGKAILAAPPDLLAAVVVAAVARLVPGVEGRGEMAAVYEIRTLLPALLRRRPPFREDDVHAILDLLAASEATWSSFVPVLPLAKAIGRWSAGRALAPATRRRLQRLCASAPGRYLYADERKAVDFLTTLLGGAEEQPGIIDPADDWGTAAIDSFSHLDPAGAAAWHAFLTHAATAASSKPSATWVKEARARVAAIGMERFAGLAAEWLSFLTRPASGGIRVGADGHLVPASLITDRNGTLLKGLAWSCSLAEDRAVAAALGDAAIACFTKIPAIGARCPKAGNACIYALGATPGMAGIAHLVRLLQRVAYADARRLIDAALDAAAARAGMTRDDLADLAVPTFALIDGRLRQSFAAFTAEIALTPDGRAPIAWFDATGEPRRTEPAGIKRAHAGELQALKRTAGEIETMLAAQRLRIERFLMTGREWPFADWLARLLDHPLLSFLTRRLIWSFATGTETALGAWLDGRLVGLDDALLDNLGAETRVRLFHPVAADPETTRAWQAWLERHRVTQPFKQAHREIYRLTDAERTAGDHSARFAGHLLHQHQLAALCRQRGWTFRLQSAFFDAANAPTLALPVDGLHAEFAVDVVEAGEENHTEMGIARYVATEYVSFGRAHRLFPQPVPLAELPPALFSEVMRDVDLFVGVASIGADPEWHGRDDERYGAYWHGISFGDLTQAADGRREVLERLLPALAIAPRCSLADRFLVVRGDLRTYQIHLGSANVLMAPNHEYLCIVQKRWGDGQRATDRVYLPFEGDAILSLILSKAFLLAADTAIADPTILRQIRC